MLSSLPDLLLVVLGFGLIVFIHELGHFVAARWAGIRVLAFAVGFGPAIVSYRKGLGLVRGSSEPEFLRRAAEGDSISPTEYRLNVLPFGGYVKMLGQEDLNPEAISPEPDSYQSCSPWKRMVVISAGVVMNLIAAAVLFIIVFMVGLQVEPARIGAVEPGSPAAMTTAINARELGLSTPGLLPGDRVISINGEQPRSFNDLMLATSMAEKGTRLELSVERSGYDTPLHFLLAPRVGAASGLLEIGVEPSRAGRIFDGKTAAERDSIAETAAALGLRGVKAGMTLLSVNERIANDANDLFSALRQSDGRHVDLVFSSDSGEQVAFSLVPRAQLQFDHAPLADRTVAPVEHLLGLMPVMTVGNATPRAVEQGLRDGDLFARIGGVEFPSIAQGITEIRNHKGRTIPVVVLRRDERGEWHEVILPAVAVSAKGQIGFGVADTSGDSALIALPLPVLRKPGTETDVRPAAAHVITAPGTRVLSVDDEPVSDFSSLRAALLKSTRHAYEMLADTTTVTLRLRPPANGVPSESVPARSVEWRLSRSDLEALHSLGWTAPPVAGLFEPEQIVLRADSPLTALSMGLAETRRVMLSTYVTFLRLWQGSVKVEHLKGPVGIAHIGTIIAGRGVMWLLFFLALISVNLAVINFLPLPIVDGGQFLFLVWEALRGRPAPIAVQSAATLVGLVFIACVFLLVTYNDIRSLLGL